MASKKSSRGDEEGRLLETLTAGLRSRDEAQKYFSKQKFDDYDTAELLKSGVRIKKHNKEEGLFPKKGQTLEVRYVGYLADGKIFDSGVFEFAFGIGEVISAWDQAFKHIRVGEKATIITPSTSAYGKHGAGKDIGPYTTLIFDVTLERMGK